jgi:hypothetical protein
LKADLRSEKSLGMPDNFTELETDGLIEANDYYTTFWANPAPSEGIGGRDSVII